MEHYLAFFSPSKRKGTVSCRKRGMLATLELSLAIPSPSLSRSVAKPKSQF